MSSMPPLKDPHILPKSPNDFRPWHVKVLRRLNKHAVNETFTGIMTLEVDIPRFTEILLKLHLIAYATYEDALSFMPKEKLQGILQENNLSKTGSKKELINRIANCIDEQKVRASERYSDYYIHTLSGKIIVDNSYDRFEKENLLFFNQIMDLILSKKYDLAWRFVHKRLAEYPVKNPLALDPVEQYHKGISSAMERQSKELMDSAEDREVTAAALFGLYTGYELRKIEIWLFKRLNTLDKKDE